MAEARHKIGKSLKLKLDIVARYRRARKDVVALREENTELKIRLNKLQGECDLLLELISKVRKGFDA